MDIKYSLQFTKAASEDFDEIYEYISNILNAPNSAKKLMAEMEEKVLNLCDFPKMYPYSEDLYLKQKGYRKLVVENYVILYLVSDEDKQVVISRAFYQAMDYFNEI